MPSLQKIIFMVSARTIAFCQSVYGQGETVPYPDYNEETFMDMEFEPNILSPAVPASASRDVVSYMKKVAMGLKDKYTVDLTRNDEVFIVTVPTDDLFNPNDTLLASFSNRYLTPLVPLMKDPYMYKILLVVHTDDTGSESYREMLSMERMNSVYDWLMDEIDKGAISEDLVIIPFSMGSTSPLVTNDTRAHRRENRRIEFYFIPGPKMIELAKNHNLK